MSDQTLPLKTLPDTQARMVEQRSMFRSALRLLACLALCLGIGLTAGLVTAPEVAGWYARLVKPAGTPPGWVFPIAWNTLYTLMGISLWLLWDRAPASGARTTAITFFFIQLALNAAWSPVFFMQHQIAAALVIIGLMDFAVLATIVATWPAKRTAALLLVPYLAWICYATWLNAGIWALNRP
jgi:tryptophan-rich sensory protein